MSINDAISVFAIMLLLAAVPGAGVALVVTRAATAGMVNGCAVTLGIVLGDLIFVALAVLGLAVVAETLGSLFLVIRYLGAAYLLWLGFSLLTKKPASCGSTLSGGRPGNLLTSFLSGLCLTLGDIKAIFFYLSLFPQFIDPANLNRTDIVIICAVTVAAVGGVKFLYALSATRIVSITRGAKFGSLARKTAAGVMLTSGGYLLFKA